MKYLSTTEARTAIGRAVRSLRQGPVVLTNRGDAVAVLISAGEARRLRVTCDHDDDPKRCPLCCLPAERGVCPHGNPDGACDACDVAGDLAYDATRESTSYRSRD